MNKIINNNFEKVIDLFFEEIQKEYNINKKRLYKFYNDKYNNYNNIDIIPGKINLGLCCINTILREQKPPIFNSRTCTRKTFTIEHAKKLAIQNIKDIIPMIKWNSENNIKCFRLSSDIFPHFTDEALPSYDINFSIKLLREVGDYIKEKNIRVLMHPGQYNQVGANTERVFNSTKKDLQHHADILDAMGIDDNGVLIVHGGGIYGDKDKTIKRWISQYFELSPEIRKRLVIENCEKCYSVQDVLYISGEIKKLGGDLPVVLDNHHYICYGQLHEDIQDSIESLIPKVLKTWGNRRPVFHISEQGDGKCGHHSDYITEIPNYYLEIPKKYGISFDLEIEAKKKEQAILRLYNKYPDLLE